MPVEIKIIIMKRMLHASAGSHYQTVSSIQEAEALCHNTIQTYLSGSVFYNTSVLIFIKCSSGAKNPYKFRGNIWDMRMKREGAYRRIPISMDASSSAYPTK